MPAKRHTERWEHPTYRYAYAREFRGMACTVIHGSFPQSTGYPWKRSVRDAVMKVLDKRLAEYLAKGTAKPITDDTTVTCRQLYDEYRRVHEPRVTRGRWYVIQRSFGFVPPNANVRDTMRIRSAVIKAVESRYDQASTKANALKAIRAVFAFGIEHGWCAVNPILKEMMPIVEYAEPEPYTASEISKGIDGSPERFKPFLRFLAATGCRPIEAVRLTWADVQDDGVYLHSSKGKGKRDRARIVPYAVVPEVVEALSSLKRGKPTDSVFGMRNYQVAAREFANALGEANRGLYAIRQYVINRWKRLGIPENVRNVMAGHSGTIAEKHYETPYSADELASIVQASGRAKVLTIPRKAHKH